MSAKVICLLSHSNKESKTRVDTLVQYGAYERAIRQCDEFIEANPMSSEGYAFKHELLVSLGKYEQSLRVAHKLHSKGHEREGLFLELVSLNLLLEGSRRRLISARSLKKQMTYAEELERKAEQTVARYQGDTQLAFTISEGFRLLGSKDKAIAVLENHLKIKPWDIHCLYQLGLIYEQGEVYEKALDYYGRSLECLESYSELLKEGFSRLICDSIEQVQKKSR